MTISEIRNKCMEKFDEKAHFLNERAKNNIELYRKGEHTIRLLNENGEPVVGARVKITQTSHDFKYGANIFMLDEFKDPEVNLKYRDTFAEFFNLATVPFYWKENEPEEGKPRYDSDSPKIYRRPPTDLCINYCEEKGIMPKLHCLFYDKYIPDWTPKENVSEMWRLYEKRFAEISERYADKFYEIEVVNELSVAHHWTTSSVLVNETNVGAKMFELARKYFPNEKLVVNDYSTVSVGRKRYCGAYYLLIKNMISHGAAIDKIGVQNHIFSGVDGTPVAEDILKKSREFDVDCMLQGLDMLSEFGRPLEITEATIPTIDGSEEAEQLQAEMLREFYKIWFATPRMESIVYWNLPDFTAFDKPNWNENNCRGGLFHYDMTPKRSALELKRLFTEEWHTDEELITNEQGFVRFRGFFGDYKASIGKDSFRFGLHRAEPTHTTHKMM